MNYSKKQLNEMAKKISKINDHLSNMIILIDEVIDSDILETTNKETLKEIKQRFTKYSGCENMLEDAEIYTSHLGYFNSIAEWLKDIEEA